MPIAVETGLNCVHVRNLRTISDDDRNQPSAAIALHCVTPMCSNNVR
jgi:hypothetical protein